MKWALCLIWVALGGVFSAEDKGRFEDAIPRQVTVASPPPNGPHLSLYIPRHFAPQQPSLNTLSPRIGYPLYASVSFLHIEKAKWEGEERPAHLSPSPSSI